MIKNTFIKQLFYKSKNRGCKENDIILERFANKELLDLGDGMLTIYSEFLHSEDREIFDWVMGRESPPQKFENLIKMIKKSNSF